MSREARMANLLVFPINSLRAAVRELMRGFGSQPKEVELVTENLLQANLTGHDSHGIGMCQATPSFTSYGDGQIYEGHRVRPNRARGPQESARARVGREVCGMLRRGTA